MKIAIIGNFTTQYTEGSDLLCRPQLDNLLTDAEIQNITVEATYGIDYAITKGDLSSTILNAFDINGIDVAILKFGDWYGSTLAEPYEVLSTNIANIVTKLKENNPNISIILLSSINKGFNHFDVWNTALSTVANNNIHFLDLNAEEFNTESGGDIIGASTSTMKLTDSGKQKVAVKIYNKLTEIDSSIPDIPSTPDNPDTGETAPVPSTPASTNKLVARFFFGDKEIMLAGIRTDGSESGSGGTTGEVNISGIETVGTTSKGYSEFLTTANKTNTSEAASIALLCDMLAVLHSRISTLETQLHGIYLTCEES